jgi:hypothetical protein
MPATTRIFVKMSIIHLAIGAALGAILMIHRWVPLGSGVPVLRASHVPLMIAGWLTQFIMGVGWWLFPPLAAHQRMSEGGKRRGQALRGGEALFWTTFATLNGGVLLKAVFEPAYAWTQLGLFRALAGISGVFLAIAAVTFVANVWQRIQKLEPAR